MVKIFVRNDKLYLEKAGKEMQISSATVSHIKEKGIYEISTFDLGGWNRGYKQKTYPLVEIELKDTHSVLVGKQKSFFNARGRTYYINYYVY